MHEAGEQARGEPVGEHVDAHTVGVERHPDEVGARGLEDLQRTDVGGILDDDGVAGVEQRAGEQVQRLLGAAGNDDLGRA